MACSVLIAPQSTTFQEVQAVESDYPLHCDARYEVSIVNNSGTFDNVGCYSSFSEAQKVMWDSGDDAVVRHSSSYSPTGIIAMNSGVAISYPMRGGSTTLTIDAANGGGKTTYVTRHREMTSASTETYNGNGDGRVYVQLNGFAGYVSLKLVDLVPMKYITNGISIKLGGKDTTSENEQPFRVTVKQAHYRVEQNGNYKDLVYYAYSGYNSTEYRIVVGKAADWMSVGSTYYSWDNYRFYNDRKFTNIAGTYYNYYQFLPIRSQSNISADVYNRFLSNLGYTKKPNSSDFNALARNETQLWNEGQTFIDNQNTYGVNALLVFSMACLESGYGRSRYAVVRNNLFGWSAFDSDPDSAQTFTSINQAIQEHMGINLRGYSDIKDFRFFGSHLGNKGSGFNVKYASDPYWGMKIAAIAYSIDKLANDNNGNLTDYDNYSLGVINTYNASVKQSANSSSSTLYTTTYGNNYQENFTVVIRSQDSTWTEIQSTNGINADGSLVTHRTNGASTGTNLNGAIAYDFGRSIGYLPTSQVTSINSKSANKPVGTTPTGDFVGKVSALSLVDGKLSIAGEAYRPGIYITDKNKVTQKLLIYNEFYESTEYTLSSTTKENDIINFTSSVDITGLALGKYYFKVSTEYSLTTDYNQEFYVNYGALPESINYGNRKYEFSTEDNITWLTISEGVNEPEEPDSPVQEKTLRQSITSVNYENSLLEITGLAFISGIDAKADSVITHYILLENMETKETIEYICATENEAKPVDIFDGYEYTRIKFNSKIDFSSLKSGNYKVILRIRNGDVTLESPVYSIKEELVPEGSEINGFKVKIFQNPTYNYRYEVTIEKNDLDLAVINKPTRRDSGFSYESIILDENALKIDGMSWIQNVSFDDDVNTVHQLILLKEDGGFINIPTQTKACSIDYSTVMGSQYSMKNICFISELKLSNLDFGQYRIYMDLKTNLYRDIFELSYYRSLNVNSVTVENKKYEFVISPVRDRLMLQITDISPNQ